MDERASRKAHQCCAMEKEKLVNQLRRCDFCSTDYESFAKCYQQAAKESGERSKACLV